ncbi:MAG: hypothetical protein N2643_02355 [Endomicrobia bacterium]|nr:hypothetical protein [Endomicrobiia bacterium]
MKKNRGFTIIEITLIVIIVSIITFLIIRSYQNIVDKTMFATAKNNLAILQRQIWLYHTVEGSYPESLVSLLNKGYIKEIPVMKIKFHQPTTNVIISNQDYDGHTDFGTWYYNYLDGTIKIACTHKDLDGMEIYRW